MINNITFLPGTGLDWDSDIDALAPGDGRYRLNVNIEEGHILGVTNMMGNSSEAKTLPAGTNKIVGWTEDGENNALIFCVYNSNDDHCIIRYNFGGTFEDISYAESFWNFQVDKVVSIAIIGEESNQQIVLTDDYNPVRKFVTATIEGGETPTEDNANLAKKAYASFVHTFDIDARAGEDFGNSAMNLRNKLFQFRYKFVYASGEESSWSAPINPTNAGIFTEEVFGLLDVTLDGDTSDVAAKITFSDFECEYIKIAFRYGDIGSGVWSLWYLADVIDVSGLSTKDWYFTNSQYYQPLDNEVDSDINLTYYDVPLKAKQCITTGNNRIMLSEPTKGTNPIDLDVEFEHEISPVTGWSNVNEGFESIDPTETYTINVGTSDRRLYAIQITVSDPGITQQFFYYMPNFAPSPVSDVVDFFVNEIDTSVIDGSLAVTDNDPEITFTNNNAVGSGTSYSIAPFFALPSTQRVTVRGGQRIQLGMIYKDDYGRSSPVFQNASTNVYIRDQNEVTGIHIGQRKYDSHIKYTINHAPPSWATQYQFVYGGSSIQRFFQIPITMGTYNSEGTITYEGDTLEYDDGVDYENSGNYTYINLQQAQRRILMSNPQLQIDYFDVQPGDMVRFLGWENGYINSYEFRSFGALFEVSVLGIEDGRLILPSIKKFSTDITQYTLVLMEVYRPADITNVENLVYYEIGRPLDIIGGNHQAYATTESNVTSQNQDIGSSDPAIGAIDWWDSYVRFQSYFVWNDDDDPRKGSKMAYGTIESQSITYLNPSRAFPLGRPHIVNEDFKQRTQRALVWGGSLSEDGIIFNELNKFIPNNIRYLEDKYGSVYGLEETGDVITVLQRKKLSSIGVGVDEVTNQDGTGSLVAIQSPFGNVRKFREEAGTIFPNSVVNNGIHVYFFDIYAHKMYRRAFNGMFAISDYKMSSYFKAKSKALLASGIAYVDVVCGWDGYHKVLYVTFIDTATPANNQSIAFHEPTNRWFTFASFIPDLYLRIGDNGVYTFKNAILYKHNVASSLRNNFYGTQYDSYVDTVLGGFDTKRFRTLKVNATDIWEAPDEDGIEIGDDEASYTDTNSIQVYDATMKSSLQANQFEYDRGEYKADFLRDATTRTGSYEALDLYRGRPLKGKSIKVKLKNSNTVKTILKSVAIRWTQK